jgi:hypothetical protein
LLQPALSFGLVITGLGAQIGHIAAQMRRDAAFRKYGPFPVVSGCLDLVQRARRLQNDLRVNNFLALMNFASGPLSGPMPHVYLRVLARVAAARWASAARVGALFAMLVLLSPSLAKAQCVFSSETDLGRGTTGLGIGGGESWLVTGTADCSGTVQGMAIRSSNTGGSVTVAIHSGAVTDPSANVLASASGTLPGTGGMAMLKLNTSVSLTSGSVYTVSVVNSGGSTLDLEGFTGTGQGGYCNPTSLCLPPTTQQFSFAVVPANYPNGIMVSGTSGIANFNNLAVGSSLNQGYNTPGPFAQAGWTRYVGDADFTGPGCSGTNCSITFAPVAGGTRVALMRAAGGDFDTFVLALGNGTNVPEIEVTDATDYTPSIIGNGANVPSLADETDFGAGEIGGAPVVRSFRITNPGTADLTVTSITVSGTLFSTPVLGGPVVIAPAGELGFAVSFAATTGGVSAAIVTILSDDFDEATFTYNIQGSGAVDYGDAPDDDGAGLSGAATGPGDYNTTSQGDGPSHIVTATLRLGALADTEGDALQTVDALGDDGDGTADEDGIILAPLFYSGADASSGSVLVTTYGAGTLYGWLDLDLNGVFGNLAAEAIIAGVATGSVGATVTTSFPVTIPAGAVTGSGVQTSFARFRFCSVAAECNAPTASGSGVNPAADGEIEDHQVTLTELTATPSLTLPSSGAIVDIVGGNVVITNADGTTTIFPAFGITSLTITGTTGDDGVVLAPALMGTAGLTVTVVLGDGFDTLTFPPASFGDVTHTFVTATDGSIAVAGGATVNYTGLDPIFDNMDVANRVFTFSAATETITLSPDGDGASGNGISFIDSGAAEEVSFVNPTMSLTINTGTGNNTVVLGTLDTVLAGTFLGVTVNGDLDPDAFTVTPAAYPITIAGAAPVGVCPGDALTLDLSGGAVVDVFTNLAGTGSYTFSSGQAPVSFTGIESVGDGDVALTANYEILYVTQDLDGTTALVVTATNDGANDVNCITVTIDADLAAWLANETVVSSAGGVYTAPDTWTISALAVGATETLTIEGFVAANAPQDVVFTSSAAQDTNAANNAVSVELSMGFMMPAKTQVNAALYYTNTVSGGVTYEALVAGIWGGAPGITGAVWCKIPSEVTGIWPVAPMTPASVGNFWRPCANELPYPLHPTDLFEDPDTGRIWLTTWGNGGLYYSDDDGETWVQSNPDPSCVIVYTITKDAGGVLYISANDGLVFRSMDGGNSWQQVGSLPGVAADTPWSMTAHPTIAGTIYAGTFGGGVFISDDFGFTWAQLNEFGTENQDLIDAFGGHVFDLEFSPDANFLYAATGTGVWQADLTAGAADFTGGGWAFMGPTVTLDDASVVTPEIRTLAFSGDGAGGATDVLVAGSWGFGAFTWADPNASAVFTPLVLRAGNVTFVAVSPSGVIFLGTDTGEQTTIVLSQSGVSTASEPVEQELPDGYVLTQNYPNPFNPVTTIGFALPETGRVRLAVYDGLGREVALLVDGTLEAGHHEARFDAMDLPTGAYLYRLTTDKGAIARTLVLMK